MSATASLLLSIMMLAVVALAIGGIIQIKRRERRGWLMLAAAAVLAGNVLIWTV